MAASPTPDFTVADEDKLPIAAHIVPAIMQTLASMSDDNVATADDVLDVLAICIASIMENDTHITTPKHTRQALETIDTFIKRWARRLRDERPAPDAPSFLETAIAEYRDQIAKLEKDGKGQPSGS